MGTFLCKRLDWIWILKISFNPNLQFGVSMTILILMPLENIQKVIGTCLMRKWDFLELFIGRPRCKNSRRKKKKKPFLLALTMWQCKPFLAVLIGSVMGCFCVFLCVFFVLFFWWESHISISSTAHEQHCKQLSLKVQQNSCCTAELRLTIVMLF